jgi:hypothetical protein
MIQNSPHDVTQLLSAWSGGDETALNRLMPLVEAELARTWLYHEIENAG